MTTKFEKMTDKVTKLLRQAEDVAGTPEEAIFQAKAFELMAKYGIDQAMVEAANGKITDQDAPDAVRRNFPVFGKYIPQQQMLLHGIVRALHGRAVIVNWMDDNGNVQSGLAVVAVPRHLDRIDALWRILRPQMLRTVKVVGRGIYTGGTLRSYRRSWIAGFASAINHRLTTEEERALNAAGSGVLVLYRSDAQRADRVFETTFPNRKRAGRKSSSYRADGYHAGVRDGRNASMAQALQ